MQMSSDLAMRSSASLEIALYCSKAAKQNRASGNKTVPTIISFRLRTADSRLAFIAVQYPQYGRYSNIAARRNRRNYRRSLANLRALPVPSPPIPTGGDCMHTSVGVPPRNRKHESFQ